MSLLLRRLVLDLVRDLWILVVHFWARHGAKPLYLDSVLRQALLLAELTDGRML